LATQRSEFKISRTLNFVRKNKCILTTARKKLTDLPNQISQNL